MRISFIYTFALLILVPGAAFADIAAHKALYDFRLVSVTPGAGISGVKGQMYYEQDDVCDAWTTDHRFTTEYQYADQPAVVNASHYVAYEAKDGRQFSFSSESQENGEMTEQLRGSVDIADDGSAKAVYSRPEDLKYGLPKGYLLPTMHTAEIIRRAQRGDSFFNAVLFDGTDADGPVEVNVFIGKKATEDEIRKIASANKKISKSLLTRDAWHVHMAVFPLKDTDKMVPAYEMDMLLHDNGVVGGMAIDYKSFKLSQNLIALETLPVRKCP